jgi:hypothetical protein
VKSTLTTIDNSAWPLNSLLVSQKHWVIYTPIAKNANTSLKRMFVRLSGYPRSAEILAGDVHTYLTSNQTGLSLCDYSPETATEILGDPDYFRYVVLRDPLVRAVSGYLDKFILYPPPPGSHGEPPIVIGTVIDWIYGRRGEAPDYNRSITFEEFVSHLSETEDSKLDTHFKSQQCYFEQQTFDYTGTLDRMDRLIKVLESKFDQKIELEHQNRTLRRKPLLRRRGQEKLLPEQLRTQRTLPHASELLTDQLLEQLKNRYATDYKLWREALT